MRKWMRIGCSALLLSLCMATQVSAQESEQVSDTALMSESEVEKIDLSVYRIQLSQTSFEYNGKSQCPSVQVWNEAGTEMLDNSCYEVTYANNVNVGEATVLVTGYGNFEGSVSATYQIIATKAPTGITTTSEYKKISLGWKKVKNADGYVIYRCESGGQYKKYAVIKDGKTTSYTDKKITMGKTYGYQIKPYRVLNEKTYYGLVSETYRQKAVVGTTKVTATKADGKKIQIKWNKVSGADGYVIYRSTSKNGTYKKIAVVSAKKALQYYDSVKVYGKPYYYKVTAYQKINGTNHLGSKSAADSAKITVGKPSFSTDCTYYKTKHKLVWSKVSGADGYEIYRANGNGYQRVKTIQSGSTVKWTDTGVKASDECRYKIRAYSIYDGKKVYGAFSSVHKRVEAGWRYVNGYKFYYDKKGNIVQDVEHLIGKQSSYVLKVNCQQNIVTVYAKDGANGYIIPVKAFVCTTGANDGTLKGTYYTPVKYRWHELMGGVYGQWCTRIHGGFLFHSVYYYGGSNANTLSTTQYNKLGTAASAGCVRLRAGDAKWIYDNCSTGTKVVLYNSSKKEPLEKPKADVLPTWHTWDPTDPTMYSKCQEKGCH